MRWLWLILISFSVSAQNTYTILIDQTLGQPVYPFSEAPSGLSEFTALFESPFIKDLTYLVTPVTENLDGAIADAKDKLLVLTPTINRSYTAQTVKNIQKFVKNGGRLLVFSEHENYYNSTSELNRITEEFGIKMLTNGYKKSKSLQDAWVTADSTLYGLRGVKFYYAATLQLAKNTTATATIDTAVFAATATYGKGKVAVISDYELAWNFAIDMNPDNAAFLAKTLSWLVGHTVFANIPGAPYDFSKGSTLNGIRVKCTGRKRFFDVFDNNTHPEKNTRFMFNNAHPFPYAYLSDDTTRVILVYDGSSNYLQMLANNNGQFVLDELNYKERIIAIDTLAKKFGLRFAQQTLVDSCTNAYIITLQPTGQKATCVSYIDTLDNQCFKVFYTADASAVDYNAPLGGEDFRVDVCLPLPINSKKEKHIVGLYNKRVFAIADMELFLNMKNNPYLLKAFNDWLKVK